MVLHPIVKYGENYFMLEKIEGETATIWRDGKRKEVPINELKYLE